MFGTEWKQPINSDYSLSQMQPLPEEVEIVLREIQGAWEIMRSDAFNPVPFALSLMEPRSRRDLDEFTNFEAKLEAAMDAIVNVYHGAFNSSIHTFSMVAEKIKDSQQRIRSNKSSMLDSRANLKIENSEFVDYWVRIAEYKGMLRLLDQIEELRQAPYKLHVFLHKQQYLSAARLYLQTSKQLQRENLDQVGALSNVRKQIASIGESMGDAMVERLNSLIYKTSVSVSSKHAAAGSVAYRMIEIGKNAITPNPVPANLDDLKDDSDDIDTNSQIINVAAALVLLNRVAQSVSAVKSRMASEIFYMIEGTITELLSERVQAETSESLMLTRPQGIESGSTKSATTSRTPTALKDIFGSNAAAYVIENDAARSKGSSYYVSTLFQRIYSRLEKVMLNHQLVMLCFQNYGSSVSSFGSNLEGEHISDYLKAQKYTLSAVWNCVKGEVKSVLLCYLTESEASSLSGHTDPSTKKENGRDLPRGEQESLALLQTDIATMFGKSSSRSKKITGLRKDIYVRPLFRLASSSTTVTGDDSQEYPGYIRDTIAEMLSSVKAQRQLIEAGSSFSVATNIASPSALSDGTGTGISLSNPNLSKKPETRFDRYIVSTAHKLIVEPNPFVVTILHPQTVRFADRMHTLLSLESHEMSNGDSVNDLQVFLNGYVQSVFLPATEDKMLRYFMEYVSGEDAFSPLKLHTLRAKLHLEFSGTGGESIGTTQPIQKSTVGLMVLVEGFALLLEKIPAHQVEFVGMLEFAITKYFDKCFARTRALLISDDIESSNVVASTWVGNADIVRLLAQSLMNASSPLPRPEFEKLLAFVGENETLLEQALKGERSFHRSELLFDYDKIKSLAHMHHSLTLLVHNLSRYIGTGAPEVSPVIKTDSKPADQWQTDTAFNDDIADNSSESGIVVLDLDDVEGYSSDDDSYAANTARSSAVSNSAGTMRLTADVAERLRAVVTNFKSLADFCIYVLHVEVRVHVFYFLDLATREGNYQLNTMPTSPDSYINSLNQDLVLFQESLTGLLPQAKIDFIIRNVPQLMNYCLLQNVAQIKAMNMYGSAKMLRNILALQHNWINMAASEKGHSFDSSITLSQASFLESVENYYKLFEKTGLQLIREIELERADFTKQEYLHIFRLKYSDAHTQLEILEESPVEAEDDTVNKASSAAAKREYLTSQIKEHAHIISRLDKFFKKKEEEHIQVL